MSRDDSPLSVATALSLGAADYLLKPLSAPLLSNIWMHVWRRRHRHALPVPLAELLPAKDSGARESGLGAHLRSRSNSAGPPGGVTRATTEACGTVTSGPGATAVGAGELLEEISSERRLLGERVGVSRLQGLPLGPPWATAVAQA